ncbi:hypothetical protein BGZ63DRAFT_341107, partial [Mariannaea sp. PMI_226]
GRQDEQEKLRVLDWIAPIDHACQQIDYIDRRQTGTGQWLLESAGFKAWVETEKQILFCPGLPGAGKTILTSIVVDELANRFRVDKSIGIAFIYCNSRWKDEQRAEDLLASLLKQLAHTHSSLPKSVRSLYKNHKVMQTRPSFNELSKALQSVTALYSRIFIMVDALDECQASNGCRSRLLSEIFTLQVKYGANIFATSRFLPEITSKFNQSLSVEIRACGEDIQRYLDGHIGQLLSFVKQNQQLQEEIKVKISGAVDGIFLLAQMYLSSLDDKPTLEAVKSALNQLSKNQESSEDENLDVLDQAYAQAMERINGQKSDLQELANRVLAWISCAKRPLKTSELQYALTVEVGQSEFNLKNLPQIEDMVSVCAGLITVDEASGIIRLVHHTTQEFFDRTRNDWFPDAEADIAKICLAYLSFSVFESGFCQSDDEFEERLESYPFYEYAAHNWGYHAGEVSTCREYISEFLKNTAKVQFATQCLLAGEPRYQKYSQRVPQGTTGVHLAAYFGLREAVDILSQQRQPLDSKDSFGRTPLSWAAQNGHEVVVNLLLERGADLNSKDNSGWTPLSLAASNGHKAVVDQLLEKGGILMQRDDSGQTPL